MRKIETKISDLSAKNEIGERIKEIEILRPSYRPPISPSHSRKEYVDRSIRVMSWLNLISTPVNLNLFSGSSGFGQSFQIDGVACLSMINVENSASSCGINYKNDVSSFKKLFWITA